MTPKNNLTAYARCMQDRQALLRFLDGVTEIQARWHPGQRMVDPGGSILC
jgi:hypothetical protein